MKTRFNWIDFAKFLGIFLVVLGHTPLPVSIINFIYSFHMPLFFFISGFLFDFNKFQSLLEFIKRRTQQLILPYLFLSLITYLFWLFIGRKFGSDSNSSLSIFTPLIGIFYGTATNNYLAHCVPLWFLPCLFVVEFIFFICFRRGKGKLLILSIIIMFGYLSLKLNLYVMPWSLNTAFISIVFYSIGNLFKDKILKAVSFKIIYRALAAVVSFIMLIFLGELNGRIDMSSNVYNNYPLFLITAVIGIFFIITLASLCQKLVLRNSFIGFFAKNTVIILAFHIAVGSVIKGFVFFLLNKNLDVFNGSFLLNLVYTILSFLVLIPIISLINKYLPFIIGREIDYSRFKRSIFIVKPSLRR